MNSIAQSLIEDWIVLLLYNLDKQEFEISSVGAKIMTNIVRGLPACHSLTTVDSVHHTHIVCDSKLILSLATQISLIKSFYFDLDK